MIRAMSDELNIFDIVCGTSFNKGKTLLEHANQFALFLVKVLCPTILANIGFDDLKPDFDVSDRLRFGTSRKLEADDLQGLLNGNPSQTQQEKNSQNSWELIEQQFRDDCMT